jgi:hypothetical protein
MARSKSSICSLLADSCSEGLLFEIGQFLATPAAIASLNEAGVNAFSLLRRHVRGDFGEVCVEDRKANLDAIQNGARIFSSYSIGRHKIWVITEAVSEGSRSATTFLLPEEY